MTSSLHSTTKKQSLRMRGFTLIELLVTIAIFMGVLIIATAALFSAEALNIRLGQNQTILDGLNLAVDTMVRDIRYGSTFYCASSLPLPTLPTDRQSCQYPNGGLILVLRPNYPLLSSGPNPGDRISYYIFNGVLYRDEYPVGATTTTKQISASDVTIKSLAFYVSGAESTPGDLNQPIVTIALSGLTVPTQPSATPVEFNIETSASARKLDY